jgi:hypothetical protein
MKKYYICKKIKRPVVLSIALENTGYTQEDYNNGLYVEINKEQADFYIKNPTAFFSEIMEMKMNRETLYEVPIEEKYRNRVEQILWEKGYTVGKELRILFNGKEETEWGQHEKDVEDAKSQAKKELNYEL